MLQRSAEAFDRGRFEDGVEWLEAFVSRLESRPPSLLKPSQVNDWVQCARWIIDSVSEH